MTNPVFVNKSVRVRARVRVRVRVKSSQVVGLSHEIPLSQAAKHEHKASISTSEPTQNTNAGLPYTLRPHGFTQITKYRLAILYIL